MNDNNMLSHQCGVCIDANSKRLFDLIELDNCLMSFEHQILPLSCEFQFFFVERIRNYNKLNVIMHDGNEAKKEEKSHSFNCDCLDCENKHGNLHLLAEVIEKNELKKQSSEMQHPQPSTSCSKDETIQTQQKKKLLNCIHCAKVFSHKGDFNKHLRKHTGDQPFSCTTCSRKFANTSNLQRHLRVHSGHKPYSCTSCNKSFNRKDKLQAHFKSKFCKRSSD